MPKMSKNVWFGSWRIGEQLLGGIQTMLNLFSVNCDLLYRWTKVYILVMHLKTSIDFIEADF